MMHGKESISIARDIPDFTSNRRAICLLDFFPHGNAGQTRAPFFLLSPIDLYSLRNSSRNENWSIVSLRAKIFILSRRISGSFQSSENMREKNASRKNKKTGNYSPLVFTPAVEVWDFVTEVYIFLYF